MHVTEACDLRFYKRLHPTYHPDQDAGHPQRLRGPSPRVCPEAAPLRKLAWLGASRTQVTRVPVPPTRHRVSDIHRVDLTHSSFILVPGIQTAPKFSYYK